MMLITYSSGKRRIAGFTMIEAVIAMVITGILASMVAIFIAGPVIGYLDSARRADLIDTADLVLRRISREVRQALPNSLRVNPSGGYTYIEFIPTSGGGAYRDVTDGSTGFPLNFSDTTACTFGTAGSNSLCKFDVIGVMPANPPISAANGDYIVVYNQGQNAAGLSYAPADAYVTANPCTDCNRAQVAAVGIEDVVADTAGRVDTLNTVRLAANGGVNVFASFTVGNTPPLKSKTQRFHVVPGLVRAVSFACPTSPATGPFYRYANYGFFPTALLAGGAIAAALAGAPADRSTMALNASCTATYDTSHSERNALLTITLTLIDSASKDSVTLVREIHLDNTP